MRTALANGLYPLVFEPPGLVAAGCITEVEVASPAARGRGRFELCVRVRRYAAGCMYCGARASRRGASRMGCGTYGGCDWPGNAAIAPAGWVADLAQSGAMIFLEGREVWLAALADLGAWVAAPPRRVAGSLTMTSGQTCAEWALLHEGARVDADLGEARAAAVQARAARRRGAAAEAARWAAAARAALPPRPWGDWGALLVCRDIFPRRHEGAGRCIHRHIDPGAAPALKAAAAAAAEAAARPGGPGAVADAMAAAAAADAANATRRAPSLLAALQGSLRVEAQVRYVHTPELRFFLLEAAKAIQTHRLELRWTKPIGSVGEQAVMSGTWMARKLLPTLEVPPPKRPRAPSPRGHRAGAAGAAGAPFEGLEEIEHRPISLLYAVLVRRGDASDAPLFVRGRMLDPVEERPGGPDGDGRAAFAHGGCAQAAQDQGARGAAMCTAEPCDEFRTVAPLLFLRY